MEALHLKGCANLIEWRSSSRLMARLNLRTPGRSSPARGLSGIGMARSIASRCLRMASSLSNSAIPRLLRLLDTLLVLRGQGRGSSASKTGVVRRDEAGASQSAKMRDLYPQIDR